MPKPMPKLVLRLDDFFAHKPKQSFTFLSGQPKGLGWHQPAGGVGCWCIVRLEPKVWIRRGTVGGAKSVILVHHTPDTDPKCTMISNNILKDHARSMFKWEPRKNWYGLLARDPSEPWDVLTRACCVLGKGSVLVDSIWLNQRNSLPLLEGVRYLSFSRYLRLAMPLSIARTLVVSGMGHAAPIAEWSGNLVTICQMLRASFEGITALGSSEPCFFFGCVQAPFALPSKAQLRIRANFQVHGWISQAAKSSQQQPRWGKLSRCLPGTVHVTTWFHGDRWNFSWKSLWKTFISGHVDAHGKRPFYQGKWW